MQQSRASTTSGSGLYLVMLALALALLCVTACGEQTGSKQTSSRAGAPTPRPRLAFHPITLPPGFNVPQGSIAISPVDGKDAWVCVAADNRSFQIWATTDEGSTWHAAGMLHPITPQQPTSCRMLADQHDTQAAVFVVGWGSGEAGDLASMSFYTRDGGQHWQQLPGWIGVTSVETDGARAYAVIIVITPPPAQPQAAPLAAVSPPRFSAPGPGQRNLERSEFIVSDDGLQAWHELHPGSQATQRTVFQFWHSPTSGDLFAATYNSALWHSPDGGVSWTQLDTPSMQISQGAWLFSQKAWMFCGWQGLGVTMCSMDSGTTWRQVPGLVSPSQCGKYCDKGGHPFVAQPEGCPPFALESDGSLLASCPFGVTDTGPDQFMVYRLAPGATNWTALGSAPSLPSSVSANGIIWCLNTQNGEWETAVLPM